MDWPHRDPFEPEDCRGTRTVNDVDQESSDAAFDALPITRIWGCLVPPPDSKLMP
jgi:hypothetical protein